MSASKQTAFDYIDEKAGVITDVSDKIWDYAELSLREYKSGDLYAKVLKEEGFTVEHPFDNIETAFRAFPAYAAGKTVDENYPRVAAALNILARKAGIYGMIGGQNADIEAEEQTTPLTTEQILFIHANKTAALIQSAMTIGATLAGATDEEIAALELCAYNVGIAFQIQDDILDVIGDSRELGKATGSDAQNHKQTYVTLHGLEESGREVERLTGEAVAVLDGFSGEHEFLKELLLHLVHRTK